MKSSKLYNKTVSSQIEVKHANESYLDMYTKQVNTVIDQYNNFYTSMMEVNSLDKINIGRNDVSDNVNENLSLDSINKAYKDNAEERLDKSTNILLSATNSITKQFGTTLEVKEKMMAEMSNHFNFVMEQSQNFWNGIFSASTQSSSVNNTANNQKNAKQKKNAVEAHLMEVISHHTIK